MEDWQRQLQAKNAQLLRSSLHDPLTGLANRAAFRNALAELMQNEVDHQTSALLFLDGDNFKLINDNWGHAAGDKVLMEVASRLMTFAGKRHLAWRLGGDEFAVLLREVRSEAEVQAPVPGANGTISSAIQPAQRSSATLSLSVGYAPGVGARHRGITARTCRSEYVSDEKPTYPADAEIIKDSL
ncbi:diguanylate cyclase [Klebsiella pneumoniae subsp. pneumoniae]|nr:diguanylate cyclase [Klebsiella pneumoniae subsp. pneumoniae]